MSRQLDAEVAEVVMGWNIYWLNSEMAVKFGTGDVVPAYSTSHDAVAIIRAEIERRGMLKTFIAALFNELIDSGDQRHDDTYWAILNATPEQQCRAAIAAMKGAR